MKSLILSLIIALTAGVSAHAQSNNKGEQQAKCQKSKENVTVVKIEDNNIFSQCFKDIDTNGDGIVDCCEAKEATFLSLERGGRSNVIDNYDFLKYFPNLTAFGVGNTPLEEIDLHNLKKLEKLHVGNAAWLKKVILAEGCKVEITGKDDVKVEYK